MTNLVTELIREYERLLSARRRSARTALGARTTGTPGPKKALQQRPEVKARQPALG
jgi:hypothetical protein